LIGPWQHCMSPNFAILQEIHRFFDTYLKGIDTGLRTEPPIHYFVQNGAGGGEWRSASGWPLPGLVMQRLYVSDGQGLRPAPGSKPVRDGFTLEKAPDCASGWGPFMQPCVARGAGVA